MPTLQELLEQARQDQDARTLQPQQPQPVDSSVIAAFNQGGIQPQGSVVQSAAQQGGIQSPMLGLARQRDEARARFEEAASALHQDPNNLEARDARAAALEEWERANAAHKQAAAAARSSGDRPGVIQQAGTGAAQTLAGLFKGASDRPTSLGIGAGEVADTVRASQEGRSVQEVEAERRQGSENFERALDEQTPEDQTTLEKGASLVGSSLPFVPAGLGTGRVAAGVTNKLRQAGAGRLKSLLGGEAVQEGILTPLTLGTADSPGEAATQVGAGMLAGTGLSRLFGAGAKPVADEAVERISLTEGKRLLDEGVPEEEVVKRLTARGLPEPEVDPDLRASAEKLFNGEGSRVQALDEAAEKVAQKSTQEVEDIVTEAEKALGPVPEEHVRIYRGEGDQLINSPSEGMPDFSGGRFFSDDPRIARAMGKRYENPRIVAVDVPRQGLDQWRTQKAGEVLVPDAVAQRSTAVKALDPDDVIEINAPLEGAETATERLTIPSRDELLEQGKGTIDEGTKEAGQEQARSAFRQQLKDSLAADGVPPSKVESVKEGGVPIEDLMAKMEAKDKRAVAEFMERTDEHVTKKLTWEQIVYSARLSNPATHIRNILGNMEYLTLDQGLVRGATTGIDIIRSAVPGQQRQVFARDMVASWAALPQGIADGITNARLAFKTGLTKAAREGLESSTGKEITELGLDVSQLSAGRRAILTPLRGLAAGDDFFRGIASAMTRDGLATRIALKEGLDGPGLANRIADLRAKPTDDMLEAMVAEGRRATFTDSGPFARAFKRMLHDPVGTSRGAEASRIVNDESLTVEEQVEQLMKHHFADSEAGARTFLGQANAAQAAAKATRMAALPFTTVPVVIAKRLGIEYNPAGLLEAAALARSGAPVEDVEKSIARVGVGTLFLVGAYQLANQGLLTGAGPREANARARWRLTNQPYSIQIGDRKWSYSNLGVVSGLLAAGATMGELAQDGETSTLGAVGLSGIAAVSEASPLDSIVELLSAAQERDEEKLTQILEFTLPTPGLARAGGRAVDPAIRDPENFSERLRSTVGAGGDVAPVVDIRGEPVERAGSALTRFISPVRPFDPVDDPVVDKLNELDMNVGFPQLSDATNREKAALRQAAQQALFNRLEEILADPRFEDMTPEAQRKVFQRAIRSVRAPISRKARSLNTSDETDFTLEDLLQ